jgi:FkbM family methyltransferase
MILENLDDLPQNCTLCLFGAGGFGEIVGRALALARPDVRVAAFADTFQQGSKLGKPIWNLSRLQQERPNLDGILICSSFSREIAQQLESMGMGPLWTAGDALLHHYSLLNPASEVQVQAALRLLEREEDRRLYSQLIAARRGAEGVAALAEHVQSKDLTPRQQYLDFIDFSKVQVLVEGGVFDGFTTREFRDRMPGDGCIFGFEPYLELYRQGPYAAQLDQVGVRVEPYALWNRETVLDFSEDASQPQQSSGASKVVRSVHEVVTRRVQAVTLDAWAARNGLQRFDFFKLDIEGSEPEALEGARGVLQRFRPQLAICIYHHPTQLHTIPLQLAEMLPNYQWRVQHYSPQIWETVWYGLPLPL